MITSFVIKGFSAGGWEIVFNFVEHPRNNFGREVDAESDRRKYTFRVLLHDIRYGINTAIFARYFISRRVRVIMCTDRE